MSNTEKPNNRMTEKPIISDDELEIILVMLNESMKECNRLNRDFMRDGERTAANYASGMATAFGQVITVLNGYRKR